MEAPPDWQCASRPSARTESVSTSFTLVFNGQPPVNIARCLEENTRCNSCCTALFAFFGSDSSSATSTVSHQSRTAGRWALDHYQHKRETKMKNRCKEFGELSLVNRLAGCMNIDINCAALRPTRVNKSKGTATKQRKPPLKAKSSRFDSLVARYYPAVYSVASRLTDDPRDAIALTRNAFRSAQKELCSLRDQTAVATSLILAVIRAALAAG